METDTQFDDESLKRIEKILLDHPVAQRYFQGLLYDLRGKRLTTLEFEQANGEVVKLDELGVGRLFMIPDGSTVWARHVWEGPGRPAALAVQSNGVFVAQDEENIVIAFKEETCSSIWIDALEVRRLMLAQSAPARLATVAFGLMAIAAYRRGFNHVSLFAAGAGPSQPRHVDAFVGYDVWPKLGFDAAVDPVDMNRFPQLNLAACRSVQDIITVDPHWWTAHGSGRVMQFDLCARSRSWSILLNYLYNALTEDPP